MEIGEIIKKRRTELGLTLEEVGNAVGVGKSTVKKWESGFIANMKRDKIALLSNILKINPVDLIDDTDISYNETQINDRQLKFALFGNPDIDDDVLDDIKAIAKVHAERKRERQKNDRH